MKSRTQTVLDLICEIAASRNAADDALLASVEKDLRASLSPATRRSLAAFLESKE